MLLPIVLAHYIINKCFLPLLLSIIIIVIIIITHILSIDSGWGSAGTGGWTFMILREISSSYWPSTLYVQSAFTNYNNKSSELLYEIGAICISISENVKFRPSNLSKVKRIPGWAKVKLLDLYHKAKFLIVT